MKILLYTQQGGLGGSFRLLLNLAEHLVQSHEVGFAFPRGQSGELALAQYPGIRAMDCGEAQAWAARCDVAIAHLVEDLAFFAELRGPRKLALCMEIVERHAPVFTEDALRRFDGYMYLHPEQAAHLDCARLAGKTFLLPLINNVRRAPAFRRTGDIGCIGAAHKHDVPVLLSVLGKLPVLSRARMRVWSTEPLKIPKPERTWRRKKLLRLFRWSGRLQEPGLDPDIVSVLGRFDLLLHSANAGNGTSTVVSDALASGKMVLLTPLPAFKQAYANLAGVHFLDQPGLRPGRLLREYDKDRFRAICDGYAARYCREGALKLWQKAIEG
jgi:hypothetical protein